MDRFARNTRDRDEAVRAGVVALDAARSHQPRVALRIQRERKDIGIAQGLRSRRIAVQDARRIGCDVGDPTATRAGPDAAVRRAREVVDETLRQRVGASQVDRHVDHREGVQRIALEAGLEADPDAIGAIGEHCGQALSGDMQTFAPAFDMAAGAIDPIQSVVAAGCPDRSRWIDAERLDPRARQARRIAGDMSQRDEIAPMRWQPRDPAIEQRKPGAAFGIAQDVHRARTRIRTRRRLFRAVALQAVFVETRNAGQRADPQTRSVGVRERRHHQGWRRVREFALIAQLGIDAEQTFARADQDAAVAIGQERHDHGRTGALGHWR